MEIALSYQRLDECNLSQEDLGKKVSKNRSTVANYLRLLKLPLEVRKHFVMINFYVMLEHFSITY